MYGARWIVCSATLTVQCRIRFMTPCLLQVSISKYLSNEKPEKIFARPSCLLYLVCCLVVASLSLLA